ncbi:MAG TPA: FAD-dependent oxidoreductase [Gammaproteobacteria bacterium]
MSSDHEAIVVGAGVAGSTAAALLAAAGWSVALVERRPFPRRKVCGECVAAPNLPLLDALGVGVAFAALAGPPLERVALYAGDEIIEADLPRAADARHPWGRALGRAELDALLMRRAAELGATLFQACDVRAVRGAPGAYVAEVREARGARRELHAPVIVRAHGSWERSPGAGSTRDRGPRASDLFAFKADFAGARLARGSLPVLAFPGGYGGMVVAERGRVTVACCIRRDRLRRCRASARGAPAGLAVERLLEEHCLGVRRALAGARRVGPWLAVGPLAPGARPTWDERSGFAVGNAAGEAHPILGEGISMAMQSAWLLCDLLRPERARLVRGAGHREVARRYAARWRRRFAGRLAWSALYAGLAMRPGARVLLPLLKRHPEWLTLAARLGGKAQRFAARDGVSLSAASFEGTS